MIYNLGLNMTRDLLWYEAVILFGFFVTKKSLIHISLLHYFNAVTSTITSNSTTMTTMGTNDAVDVDDQETQRMTPEFNYEFLSPASNYIYPSSEGLVGDHFPDHDNFSVNSYGNPGICIQGMDGVTSTSDFMPLKPQGFLLQFNEGVPASSSSSGDGGGGGAPTAVVVESEIEEGQLVEEEGEAMDVIVQEVMMPPSPSSSSTSVVTISAHHLQPQMTPPPHPSSPSFIMSTSQQQRIPVRGGSRLSSAVAATATTSSSSSIIATDTVTPVMHVTLAKIFDDHYSTRLNKMGPFTIEEAQFVQTFFQSDAETAMSFLAFKLDELRTHTLMHTNPKSLYLQCLESEHLDKQDAQLLRYFLLFWDLTHTYMTGEVIIKSVVSFLRGGPQQQQKQIMTESLCLIARALCASQEFTMRQMTLLSFITDLAVPKEASDNFDSVMKFKSDLLIYNASAYTTEGKLEVDIMPLEDTTGRLSFMMNPSFDLLTDKESFMNLFNHLKTMNVAPQGLFSLFVPRRLHTGQ